MMKSTTTSKNVQAERREAARIRKAKSRFMAKENGMQRIRLNVGFLEAKAIGLWADKHGITQSKVVELMINHNVVDGVWALRKPFVGICVESVATEVDVTLPANVAKHLRRYKELTPGDLVSLLVGIDLNPKWSDDDPIHIGTMPDGSPVRMVGAREAAWNFKNHTYEGMVATGREREAKAWWPNRKHQISSIHAMDRAEWAKDRAEALLPTQLTWHANNERADPPKYTSVKSRECYPGEEATPPPVVLNQRNRPHKPTWKYNYDTETWGWSHLTEAA